MKKPRKKYDEVNYWESMADSMVGLLLCVLLVTLLLVLYVVRVPNDKNVDTEEGNSYEQYHDPDDGGGNHANGTVDNELGDGWESEQELFDEAEGDDDWSGGDGGYGGAGDTVEEVERHDFDDPDPGAGDGLGTDRAAVFVQLVDSETGRTVKKKNVEFELYAGENALQVLATYYPKKTEYTKFSTDNTGVFYLPERIPLTSYTLHAITMITGYDAAENTQFTLEESCDWEDPYVVSVTVSPSKNTIRLQLKDKEDASAITDASFSVAAAEDIVTQDGTTRCRAGDIVDTIVVDEKGEGESIPLYLGKYILRQNQVPEYYSKITGDTNISVLSKGDQDTKSIVQLQEEKTGAVVNVTDALYDTIYIEGAKFTLKDSSGNVIERYTTDAKGRFTISDLKKNTTYHLEQTQTITDYQIDPADYSIIVRADGMIDGAAKEEITIRNRILRVSIGVRDKLFRGQISDVNITLVDAEGTAVRTWDSTGIEQTIEGLAPGEYKVLIGGSESQENRIVVEDTTDLQTYQFDRWTPTDIGSILGASVAGIGLIVLLVTLLKRRRMERYHNGE